MKTYVLNHIERQRVIPVIRTDCKETASKLINCALEGGMTTLEITMTVPEAPTLIKQLKENYGDKVLIGAGTVTSREQAKSCLDNHADFIVSPFIVKEVIEEANKKNVVMMPGAMTVNEVYQAHYLGGDVVKVFPSFTVGQKFFTAVNDILPNVKLMATGGVDQNNVGEWLERGIFAVGIGNVINRCLEAKGEQEVVKLCRKILENSKS